MRLELGNSSKAKLAKVVKHLTEKSRMSFKC